MIVDVPPFEIIRRHQNEAPVNVLAMARDFGLSVYTDELDPDVSTRLVQSKEFGGSSGYVLLINKADSPGKQLYSVAHGLAHFILHRSQIPQGGLRDNGLYISQLGVRAEADANVLAAEILMPVHLIGKYRSLGLSTTEALARQFQVPEGMLTAWLKRMERPGVWRMSSVR